MSNIRSGDGGKPTGREIAKFVLIRIVLQRMVQNQSEPFRTVC